MSGSLDTPMFDSSKPKCPHNILRKKRSSEPHEYTFNAYVCGTCAQIFKVEAWEEPDNSGPKEPMFPNPIPWGLRNRQA